MSFLDLCRKRQSTRKYKPDEVPREAVERCLEAARLAPSACNSQPWRFIVVTDPELKARVCDKAFSGVYRMCRFAAEAPVIVVVVTERSKFSARLGGQFRGVQYALVDIGIAVEHFVLQATEEGLGTCWLGWFSERGVKKALGLASKDRVDIVLSLGHPADEDRAKVRMDMDDMREYR